MSFEAWQLAAMEEYGYMDTERGLINRLARYLANSPNHTILTCSTESDSVLAPHIKNGTYPAGKAKIRFTTCRKFKGLEADAVILVDVDESTFLGNGGKNILLYYVGCSRARLRLDIVANLDSDNCIQILKSLGKADRIKNPSRDLSRALNALPVVQTS